MDAAANPSLLQCVLRQSGITLNADFTCRRAAVGRGLEVCMAVEVRKKIKIYAVLYSLKASKKDGVLCGVLGTVSSCVLENVCII